MAYNIVEKIFLKHRADKTQKLVAGQKAAIIVTHSLAIIRNVDTIAVMENGKLTAKGTHRELLSYDNYYSRSHQAEAEMN